MAVMPLATTARMPAVTETSATTGRREQILEAALRVIGRSGREAVTHRAVAQEAGVPLGSTTYYFDSRDELLGQALEHVARRETERYVEMAEELRGAKTSRQLADILLSELVADAQDRIAYIAEYELWLEASRRPELRAAAQAWCDSVQLAVAGAMEKLGSTNPAADASLVVAAIDGLGERVLGREEDLSGAAAEFRPQLRRLIERLVG
jgi:TetR/AcrR family transcriptional regulator, regulator of biofilm formation and stress response